MLKNIKSIIIFANLMQIATWAAIARAAAEESANFSSLMLISAMNHEGHHTHANFDANLSFKSWWSADQLAPSLVVMPATAGSTETPSPSAAEDTKSQVPNPVVTPAAETQSPSPSEISPAVTEQAPAAAPTVEPNPSEATPAASDVPAPQTVPEQPPAQRQSSDVSNERPTATTENALETSPAVESSPNDKTKPYGNKAKKSLAPPRKATNGSAQQKQKRPNTGGNIPKGRTILDLQRDSRSTTIALQGEDGTAGSATLVDLNPAFGVWYLLRIRFTADSPEYGFNLESAYPDRIRIGLDPKYPQGVMIVEGDKATPCPLFDKAQRVPLLDSLKSQNAFSSLCDNKIFTRNKVDGRKTTKEWVSEFLRDNVWGGEEVTTFVKDKFFKDKYLIAGDLEKAKPGSSAQRQDSKMPRPAQVSAASREVLLPSTSLGLSIAGEDGHKKMAPGQWYELKTHDGIFVSSIETALIDPAALNKHKSLVNKLDSVEDNAVIYLVAFDLSEFRMGFTMGTDHPRVDWSPRVIEEVRDRSTGGPDGIANWAPLITTGMINPVLHDEVIATFTGGFKRDHGAMRWGALAYKNKGTHYGFIENGVIFSRLNPGLSTLFMTRSGQIEMRTWDESDSALETQVLFARQNGLPIIEWDSATQSGVPGKLVRQWGPGNWSGSEGSKLRTLRAGVCLLETEARQFLVYGYFSSATPSAMAQTFHAYGCRYAMHMDMNALEHTYLAIYAREGKQLSVEHLINGMNVLDKQFKNQTVPRFMGFPDNRDFFYLYRKK